jgi:tricorn protease
MKSCETFRPSRIFVVILFFLSGLAFLLDQRSLAQAGAKHLLLQTPSLSATQIAFTYGGDVWVVSRHGGTAQRLVTGTDLLSGPIFSPDGSMVAYSGNYDGNVDVYVVPASGGEPQRLTYHPGPDVAVGWTPDGKNVLFRSNRVSTNDFPHLFTIPVNGGAASEIPLPMAGVGSFSPDGKRLAYEPIMQREPYWQKYHGGQTLKVWIADLADSSVVEVPRVNSNDKNPMWIGNKVYFLSDRNGPVTLFVYDTGTKKVSQVVENEDGFNISSAAAGPGDIVYAQFGVLHLYDLKSGKDSLVHVTVAGDMPQLRPHFVKVADQILNSGISPTGKRAVFEAHGEILTVPGEKGDIRNITNSPNVADRDPTWSPDGQRIAYFSDESGEYALHIRNQNGLGPVRKIDLGNPPSFFYSPIWSPDSKKIAYADKRQNLWYVDLAHPTPVKVDTDKHVDKLLGREASIRWSPDSQWLTYTKHLPNNLSAVFVYSMDTGKATQITDGMSDALYPAFDEDGKYLYFTASTNVGLSAVGMAMTSLAHPITRGVYIAVLRKDLPSPLAPESNEEEATTDEKETGDVGKPAAADASENGGKQAVANKDKKPPMVTIDFDGLDQRILALPLPQRNYVAVDAGNLGILYLGEASVVQAPGVSPGITVQRFDLKKREATQVLTGVSAFDISADGSSMLYKMGNSWFINPADAAPKPDKGMLKTADMEVKVNPRAEWQQMYHEVWRIERDFFYDPNFHGLNIQQAEQHFAPYLDGVGNREDLNYLFREMLSYLSIGHMFVTGGEEPETPKANVGLLGADYNVENGRYRFTKIYNGENWNPQMHAPLTQPAVNVKAGEYLLAVNGQDIFGTDNLYRFFEETAGKQTALKVGPNADGSSSREVTVVPVAQDFELRNLDWIASNRRLVDKLSGGKLAYVYLPNTGGGGFTNFNRYYYAQVGKEGAIIDERFNSGGQIADYIIEQLNIKPMNMEVTREGTTFIHPAEAIYGPKVMLINQFARSGGDALPWLFKQTGIGPLVGMKTWGGLVGLGGDPVLMDGGSVTAPSLAIYGLNGHWEVENQGIAPDYQVEMDPKLVREGHDPQLEKAVQVAMDLLKKNPPAQHPLPEYPNYHPHLPAVQ